MIDVGICLYPGAQAAAVYGLSDFFEVANLCARERAMPEARRIRSSRWSDDGLGNIYCCSAPFTEHKLQFVIVPPSLTNPPGADLLRPITQWLGLMHAGGATLCAICVGIFLLAETGLLAGRPAAARSCDVVRLKGRFPDIEIVEATASRLVFDDGDVVTTAGVMSWTDLGFWLVDRTLGYVVAEDTAKYMALELPKWLRPNLFNPNFDHNDQCILRVQRLLQSKDAMGTPIAGMAAVANLEPRTFLRRFVRATGMKPSEYCQHVRVKRACEMLDFTNKSVDQIAWLVGYRDARAFSKIFVKHVGLTPTGYRNRISVKQEPFRKEKWFSNNSIFL